MLIIGLNNDVVQTVLNFLEKTILNCHSFKDDNRGEDCRLLEPQEQLDNLDYYLNMSEEIKPDFLRQSEREKLFRVRKTVMESLKDRGYVVADSEIEMTEEQFLQKYGENFKRKDLDFSRSKHVNPLDKICVFFVDENDVLGIKQLEAYVDRMKEASVSRAMLILAQAPSQMAKRVIESRTLTCHVEYFLDQELMFNVTKHDMVPKHQLLTADEVKILVDQYHLTLSQLPQIQVTDPVARYLGVMPGQVLKISRPSETAGKYVTYRVVV
ncbi:hypothetical protein NE237_008624 [Protea cynaroides]|uniref:RPB5 homolog n=1 Tax=Protea cynaroides TaxID=273540 RepID=A0A9Q0KX35_9MAGN|nr:hypothetical protein NE237_008624 [Protea cynaroides]